jgi:hypothetical protein
MLVRHYPNEKSGPTYINFLWSGDDCKIVLETTFFIEKFSKISLLLKYIQNEMSCETFDNGNVKICTDLSPGVDFYLRKHF